MTRVLIFSLSILLICSTASMAASDSELARQHMADNPLPIPPPPPLPAPKSAPAHAPGSAATAAPAPAVAAQPAPATPAPAAAEADVARIKTFAGAASIARREQTIPVKMDEKIYMGDTLKTGADGSMGIIFKDSTSLSLGPNSTVVIKEFLFAPAQGKLSIVTRMIKGTAAYLSGVIAKLSPQSVRFETPVATVGFRGTRFLVKIDEEKSN